MNDTAELVLLHGGQRGFGQVVGPKDEGGVHGGKIVIGVIAEFFFILGWGGVDDQGVWGLSEVCADVTDELGDACLAEGIGLEDSSATSIGSVLLDFCQGLTRVGFVMGVVEGDLVAGLAKSDGDGTAEATGGAGDEDGSGHDNWEAATRQLKLRVEVEVSDCVAVVGEK